VEAERALLEALGGGCSLPMGALATFEEGTLRLLAAVAAPDGRRLLRVEAAAHAADPDAVAREAAQRLLAAGAGALLAADA
jgi:hydroxymethylbilane synthase